ncbi:MAG: hypothetical protein ACFE9L_00950 [Candidatus Hodarchaeota archaeon]
MKEKLNYNRYWALLLHDFVKREFDPTDNFAVDFLLYLNSFNLPLSNIRKRFGKYSVLFDTYITKFTENALIDPSSYELTSKGKKILFFKGFQEEYPINPDLEPIRGVLAERVIQGIKREIKENIPLGDLLNMGVSSVQLEEAFLDLVYNEAMMGYINSRYELTLLDYNESRLKNYALYQKSIDDLNHLHVLIITDKYNNDAGEPIPTLGVLQQLIIYARRVKISHFNKNYGKIQIPSIQTLDFFPLGQSLFQTGLETLFLSSYGLIKFQREWFESGFQESSTINLELKNKGAEITNTLYKKEEESPLIEWLGFSAQSSVTEILGI